jgi:hypothetical protein
MIRHPRGFYKDRSHEKWSKDISTGYYNTPMLFLVYPLFKLFILSCVFLFCSQVIGNWQLGMVAVLTLLLTY